MPTMPARSRSIIGPALAAMSTILLAVGWLMMQEPPPLQVCRLPDGSELRLEAVTFGRRGQLVKGRYWQRLLAPLVSPSLQQRFGASVYTYQLLTPKSATPLVFWISRRPSSSVAYMMRAVALDEHGSQTDGGLLPVAFVPPFSDGMRCCALPAFPRRGRQVRLRLTRWGHLRPTAEFTVPNPAPGPYPVWTAAPPPISKRDGDLIFTLTRFATALAAPAQVAAVFRGSRWTDAAFRVVERGKLSGRWEPVGMALSDATGNIIGPSMAAGEPVQFAANGEQHVEVPASLPADESAWKLRTEFVLTRGFSAGDLWTVKSIPLPARGKQFFSSYWLARHQRKVKLRLLVTRNGGESGSFRVNVRLYTPVEGLRIGLLRVTDDRGRSLTRLPSGDSPASFFLLGGDALRDSLVAAQPSGTSSMIGEGGTECAYRVDSPADARRVDLTFAVVKSHFVEFLARPARPVPARSPARPLAAGERRAPA